MSGKSRTAVRQLLKKGAVSSNGKKLRRLDDVLLAGSSVVITPKPEPHFDMPDGLRIVYEDRWVIVVEKDAGLLTVATDTERTHTVMSYLNAYMKFYHRDGEIFIVHRIDRGTSGLLLFAKTEAVQHTLRENWNDMIVSRRYVAVVEGVLPCNEGTIDTWIKENPKSLRMFVSRPGDGKRAITNFKALETNGR